VNAIKDTTEMVLPATVRNNSIYCHTHVTVYISGHVILESCMNSTHEHHVRNYALNLSCDDVDIDECAADNGGCSSEATCINTPGSFKCTCLPGYRGCGFNCTGKWKTNLILSTK